MPHPRRTVVRPARLRSPSPGDGRRHIGEEGAVLGISGSSGGGMASASRRHQPALVASDPQPARGPEAGGGPLRAVRRFRVNHQAARACADPVLWRGRSIAGQAGAQPARSASGLIHHQLSPPENRQMMESSYRRSSGPRYMGADNFGHGTHPEGASSQVFDYGHGDREVVAQRLSPAGGNESGGHGRKVQDSLEGSILGGDWGPRTERDDLGYRGGTRFRPSPSATFVPSSVNTPDAGFVRNVSVDMLETNDGFLSASQNQQPGVQGTEGRAVESGAAAGGSSSGTMDRATGDVSASVEERPAVRLPAGPGPEVEVTDERDHHAGIRGLAERGLAQSTLRVYRAAWRQWVRFSASKDQSEAGQRDAVMEFMWLKFCEGASKASMSSTLAGISFMSRLNGTVDITKGFLISKALKGWAKERPTPTDTRHPITIQILAQLMRILVDVARDEYEVLLFRTAFSLAFFGAFRVAELVGQAAGHVSAGLLTEDVVIRKDHLSVRIARSKTDQKGRGCWLQLQAQKDKELCPVELTTQFSLIRPSDSIFLIHKEKTQLTRYQFNAVLKQAIKLLGLNPSFFSSHSFRIGAATSAYQSYIRPNV
ncbi:uncharacterized protein LOC142097913 [Mixophyes fleayi]|uniref:uncharacterized protein LOC142097913 n=1 Tax=Mixophyes fleayi TaxID=3061075 RepID=UPI003F4DC306